MTSCVRESDTRSQPMAFDPHRLDAKEQASLELAPVLVESSHSLVDGSCVEVELATRQQLVVVVQAEFVSGVPRRGDGFEVTRRHVGLVLQYPRDVAAP